MATAQGHVHMLQRRAARLGVGVCHVIQTDLFENLWRRQRRARRNCRGPTSEERLQIFEEERALVDGPDARHDRAHSASQQPNGEQCSAGRREAELPVCYERKRHGERCSREPA